MKEENLIFVGVCDWAGIVRGKAFLAADRQERLKKGGWPYTFQHRDVVFRTDLHDTFRYVGRSHHSPGSTNAD